MNPLQVLVLEDEAPARNYLVELIQATGRASVVAAVGTVDEVHQALARLTVDAVFVDLHLDGTGDHRSGLDLIRSVAEEPSSPMFVVATAFQQHSLQAFECGVVDYLLKPFSDERVDQCLRRLEMRRRAQPRSSPRVVARRKQNLVFVSPRDIWAFEASDRLTFVHSPEGRLDVDLSLAAIEAELADAFVRVHRNWLVNLDQTKELEREDGDLSLLVGGESGTGRLRVPVSRDRWKAVKERLLTNATGIRRSL